MLTDEQVDALLTALCGEGIDLREGRAIFRAGMLEAARIAENRDAMMARIAATGETVLMDSIATVIRRQSAGEP